MFEMCAFYDSTRSGGVDVGMPVREIADAANSLLMRFLLALSF